MSAVLLLRMRLLKTLMLLGGRFRGWARFCALIFDDAAHLIIKFK
ncbi:hypothetical protein CAMRE0001_0843 [Campylobacter rectus RM3267]|uniref:Uncharacterized protein n=1 Tax=Campylobacter rectus RM3267 TaxID=553218 RepID=B9D4X9_CAMRE|nr:hypothetical protein CAMRE0001_0843 [Campylobacter rectus RM3267]